MGIPYTGSGPLELAICLNKARAKEVLAFNGIPTPDFRVIEPDLPIRLDRFRFPAIIKPVAEGSSKGIFDDSVIESKAEAVKKIQAAFLKYRQPVLVEQFLEGDEFTVAVWGNGDKVEVLPIVAIRYDDLPAGARPIYSYEAKWIWDTPEKPLEIFKCPASISKTRQKAIETVVRAAYRVLHIKDWCRIDVRLDGKGKPHILELNPLPGILPKPEDNSCFPKAARTAGYDYPAMLEKIIGIAAERWGIRA
jgi:D-alanine-D-alanine ligase